MSKFQVVILGLFVIFLVAGVAAFATYRGGGNVKNQLPPITVWGTFPQQIFTNYLSQVNITLATQLSVNYIEINPASFSQQFIAALARGQGPDAVLIPVDMLLPHLDKIVPIPVTALPQRSFKEVYIQEAEIYLGQQGTYALPFVVDPMVMYWNRDTFSVNGLATYPRNWDEFIPVNHKITTKDEMGGIRTSAIALGDFTNVVNAREILATLMFQTGNNITAGSGNDLHSIMTKDPSAEAAFKFFTNFVDPNNENYSWNRGMPDSKTAFLSGRLATYFGFASEIADIRSKNPNLNFDVAPIPQVKNGVKAVYGKMYGVSIVRTSPNQNAVYQIFSTLNSPSYMPILNAALYLPAVRRDLIAAGSTDPYITVFNEQALISKTWLDADPIQSANVFGNMVNSITSGAKSLRTAVLDGNDRYDVVLKQSVQ